MLARDLALALDPARFMEHLGLPPDPWQENILRRDALRALLLCGRQVGKSTVAAVLALHRALYRPPALVLLLSPALRQSGELFRTTMSFYHKLPDPVPAEEESTLRIRFANGSRIISLPGQEATVRGFAGVDLLVIDEASRVADELYYAVRPMLAVSGGSLLALTTPFGKRGFFFHEWTEGGPQWARVNVPATECPRIPAALLEQERASLGDWWYRQEYLCEFKDTVDQVFSFEHVMGALDASVKPLFAPAVGGEP
jgi:hypothetical protein